MKRLLIGLGLIILLGSSSAVTYKLTERSKSQVVLHDKSVKVLAKEINDNYLNGYRVTMAVSGGSDTSSEVLVIMEK